MIRAAIVGLGDISQVHLSSIQSLNNARLVAGCDIDPSRRASLPEGTAFYTNYEEMLEQEKPDVAHICLPHYLHYPVAKTIAGAGRNIFAEKPLALNGPEAAAYALLEKETGVKICLCLQNRCNPTSETLYQLLRSGTYGQVTGVRGAVAWYRSREYYNNKPWRASMAWAGGGCMINQSIHTMDLMQHFAGSPMRSIKGNIAQVLDYGIEVEDTASARIVFENGAIGLFSATVANYEDTDVEIDVRCERALFTIRNRTLYRIQDNKQEELASDSSAFAGKQVYGNSHVKLINTFYQVLEKGGGWYIHPEEGLPSMRMIDAIRESSGTGKTVYLS
jgi:predicted dehydrogenase